MTIAECEEQWDGARIIEIENSLLQGIFGCRTPESVEAAVTYANFLSSIGITAENYPVFLKMLEIENHWVIDALIGERDPYLMLSPVQPNTYIVNRIFAMITKWHKGGIYSKNLSVILGVLQSVYSSPRDGYRIYPLNIADVNALGKHLEKEKGQDDPQNRVILEILDQISRLEGLGNTDAEEVAIQASAIRNAFFDNRKQMDEVIPPVLLLAMEDRVEIAPRDLKRAAAGPKKKQSSKKKRKKVSASNS
ncbi:MAG: hypothetical protein P8X96_25415 [Desulfobacteraceae bacterium]|jgi:hypothetical protein